MTCENSLQELRIKKKHQKNVIVKTVDGTTALLLFTAF